MSEQTKKNLTRNVIVVLAAMVAGTIVIYAIEQLGHSIFPPPKIPTETTLANIDAALELYFENMPVGALLVVGLAHLIGVAVACWIGFKFARESRMPGLIVGVLYLLFTIVNLLSFPHPLWFIILDIALVVAAIFIPMRALKD